MFHGAGPIADTGHVQSADGDGRARLDVARQQPAAQEAAAAHTGRGTGPNPTAVGPVRRVQLRSADFGRRGRRSRRLPRGQLLRRVRPVRGQRAAPDPGPAVGDHRQAAGQRSAVPRPDGHADREHQDRDAAVPVDGRPQERGRQTVRGGARGVRPRVPGRVHGNVLRSRGRRRSRVACTLVETATVTGSAVTGLSRCPSPRHPTVPDRNTRATSCIRFSSRSNRSG